MHLGEGVSTPSLPSTSPLQTTLPVVLSRAELNAMKQTWGLKPQVCLLMLVWGWRVFAGESVGRRRCLMMMATTPHPMKRVWQRDAEESQHMEEG